MSYSEALGFNSTKLDILGATLQLLAGPTDFGTDIGFLAGDIPPGGVAALHSHEDVEVIAVLAGVLDVYQESGADAGWTQARGGDVVVIPGGMKHALQNKQSQSMRSVFVTQGKLFNFFKETGEPFSGKPGLPSGAQLERFMRTAAAYGYWMASPQENAAIGLTLMAPPQP